MLVIYKCLASISRLLRAGAKTDRSRRLCCADPAVMLDMDGGSRPGAPSCLIVRSSFMRHRILGRSGLSVSALGLGCSGMSSGYGVPDDAESTRTIHRAIELGVTLFDTSDAYGNGRNELLLGQAIRDRRDGLVIASKFGNIRGPKGERGGTNSRPDYVPIACEKSLERLGIEVIDLYYQHRVDPDVPIEDTVGAVAKLVDAGKVRHLGLCEACPVPPSVPNPPSITLTNERFIPRHIM
jgi:hypothetical protein